MLKQHSQLMITLLVVADAVAVAVAWLAAYWVRFTWLPVDPAKGVPDLADKYLPMLPLVEDIALSRALKRATAPLCLREKIVASGRRWERRGVARTILLMWRMRLAYYLGADPAGLAPRYDDVR